MTAFRLIGELLSELRNAGGATRSTVRRKVRTIAASCGRKNATSALLENVRRELKGAGIFTEPSLVDPGLKPDDWVAFSLSPFPPKPHLLAKEEHLRQVVLACLGHGVFRHLELFTRRGGVTGVEYRLPNNKRIDLLCQERVRSGAGALVAIELKRGTRSGTVHQLSGYLETLRELFAPREVRGMIISSEEAPAPEETQQLEGRQDIEWFCYRIEFTQLQAPRGRAPAEPQLGKIVGAANRAATPVNPARATATPRRRRRRRR